MRAIVLVFYDRGASKLGREGILPAETLFGRKPKLSAYQRQEALERLAEGESQSTIARSFNVDRATISRLTRR